MGNGMNEIAYFNNVVHIVYDTKSFINRRRKVKRIIVSYKTPNEIEYRRGFEFPRDITDKKALEEIPITISVQTT